MKYTAINIGPIVPTITMARRPRELWAASYLFSYLMECIIAKIMEEIGNDEDRLISPALLSEVENPIKNVGLYPDRVFISGEFDVKKVVGEATEIFANSIKIEKKMVERYINIMYVSIDYNSQKEAESPIKQLNRLLDCMELYNRPLENDSLNKVLKLIRMTSGSPLFQLAEKGNEFKVPMLAEIAAHQLSLVDNNIWNAICKTAKDKEQELEKDKKKGKNDKFSVEDYFYQWIKEQFPNEYKSYYKYICVVQADGDCMGKIVSSLPLYKVKDLSKTLLEYGCAASRLIEGYGGLPVYAGGDDLLFIAPVVSDYEYEVKSGVIKPIQNIFGLLYEIDALYKNVDEKVGELGRPVQKMKRWDGVETISEMHTSVSYGLSITYYKYPLYEALEDARFLLFGKAKNMPGKNAVAWCLRKHSGSGFEGAFTKENKVDSVDTQFDGLMDFPVEDKLVSVVAHKLKVNEAVLNMIRQEKKEMREERLNSFYKNELEEIDPRINSYIGNTRKLLNALLENSKEDENRERREVCGQMYRIMSDADGVDDVLKQLKEILEKVEENGKLRMKDILKQMYGMLRTAKFINGEEDYNE